MQLLAPGKVAVVTGIGPGLGREIALGFAELGAKLVIGARSAETLESVASEIRAKGGEAWYLAAKDEGHGFRKKANQDVYLETAAMFLNKLAH